LGIFDRTFFFFFWSWNSVDFEFGHIKQKE